MNQRTAFYELPSSRLGEFSEAARGRRRGRAKSEVEVFLAGLARPLPDHDSPHFYLAAALGVIGDTPLPSGAEMLGDGSARYTEVLERLVEGHGGGWEIIEPSDERLAALDPETFDAGRLQAHYTGEVDYYPDDEDEADDDQGVLANLIDWLASRTTEDDYPSDAGEQIRTSIALLRTALEQIDRRSVLLIRLR